jgi:hypothetical protein
MYMATFNADVQKQMPALFRLLVEMTILLTVGRMEAAGVADAPLSGERYSLPLNLQLHLRLCH